MSKRKKKKTLKDLQKTWKTIAQERLNPRKENKEIKGGSKTFARYL